MEKGRLPPELRSMVDQFSKFRDEYLTLKTHNAAQEELIALQKMELEKMNSHVEQLASALIDYQKRFNSTLHHLESEKSRLQNVLDSVRREREDSRDNDNEFVREVQRNNDEHIRRLEDDLEALRAELASRDAKHKDRIESIEESHKNEILIREEQLEHLKLLEKRHKGEIDAYKKMLKQFESTKRRCNEVSTEPENLHPALNNDTASSVNKRKTSAPTSCRWPQLDISVKKEKGTAQKTAALRKKRKLFLADDEIVVDLTSVKDL